MARQRTRQDQGPPVSIPPSVGALLGPEHDSLLAALSEEGPVSIRINPLKPHGPEGEPIPWCARGRYLRERPVFTLDPLFHLGAYYVQEASSMLLEQAFVRTGLGGQTVLALDLCAAPGGKSTHLASLLSRDALLVCNEVVAARRDVLAENLWKHGFPNTMVAGSAPAAFSSLVNTFDLVLVDAPCSGEGMFRKDPFARQQWNEKLVASCARDQGEILRQAWPTVRPGGWLIYSTCTWERAENEAQVERLLEQGAEHIPIPMPADWGVVASDLGYRCYPHRVKGEGFYLALLHKPGRSEPHARVPNDAPVDGEVRSWLQRPEACVLQEEGDVIFASPAGWSAALGALRSGLRLTSPGIPVAERKGATWRPHPALALSGLLARGGFTEVELSEAEALTFLRGETALPMGSNVAGASGVRLLRYAGLPLGWMHPAGDRWNNGWPKPWRIRMR